MQAASHHAMPYCPVHNRLFPHPFVGWLTPHGIQGLAIKASRCDRCIKEQGDVVLQYGFPLGPQHYPEKDRLL